MVRGSGLRVGPEGVVCYHHYLLPKDNSQFIFEAGEYTMSVHAQVVGRASPVLLFQERFPLANDLASEIQNENAGVFFDWAPELKTYVSHVDVRPSPRARSFDENLLEAEG